MSEREVRRHDLPPRRLSERAQALVDQAEATDRARRFDLRREVVATVRERRRRRSLATWLSVAAVVAVGAAIVGVALAGPSGIVAGALGGVVPAGRWGMDRAARRRGAEGWDWRRQRHVLTSNPAREVQEWDDPRAR